MEKIATAVCILNVCENSTQKLPNIISCQDISKIVQSAHSPYYIKADSHKLHLMHIAEAEVCSVEKYKNSYL